MATITEDYVSFETALLLKEKGFEQVGCQKQYNTQGDLCVGYCYGPVAPTLQMAMKYLREVHKILITIVPQEVNVGIDRMCYAIYKITEDLYQPLYNGKVDNLVDSYEETVESAIKYCLEYLI